jgi:cytochrome P450
MQRVTDLALPYLGISDPEFAKDPFSRFQAAREQHPWLAKTDYGYVVTEYAAIRDLLGMDDRMRPAHEVIIAALDAYGSHWERFQLESLMAVGGDTHRRIRDVVAPMFTPRAANMHRRLMRATIAGVLDEWVPKGRFDFEEFASYFPINVMGSLLGADPAAIPGLRASLETLGLSFNMIPGFLPKLDEACRTLEAYLASFIAERKAGVRRNAEPDLLDALLGAYDAGGLSEAELNSLLIFLFVAGYDTSKNVLTFIMHELLTRPDMYERCAHDQVFCRKVVEESLRFQSPGTASRIADQDIVYRDALIPKDTMLFLPMSVAGRDPSAFPDPDAFDPERPNAGRHLAFGRGMHMCLGQYIARAQIEEGLHQIAQRVREPRLVGEYGFRPFPGTWGMKGLPIEFTPAAAQPSEAAPDLAETPPA